MSDDFIQFEISVTNGDLFDTWIDVLGEAPDVANQMVSATVNENADSTLADLRTEPGEVVYPIQWASVRQRRAFFASNGFGRGIPTRRTHDLVNAWKLIVVYTPGQMTAAVFTNDTPYRKFVIGGYQQPFHRNTGWYNETDKLADAQAKLEGELETDLIRLLYVLYALRESR